MSENETKTEDILVGLDGSRPSKSAAKFAVQIAQNLNWSIHGIFVIDETIILGSYEFNKAELGSAAAQSALKWAVRFQKAMHCQVFVVTVNETSEPTSHLLSRIEQDLQDEGLEIGDLIAERSDLAEAILNAVSSTSDDLILMGKYSHIRLLKWLFGSKVDVILHHTQCPIWMA